MIMFQTEHSIHIVRVADWLDWAGGHNGETVVALPMIQRGSVWQPHQVVELWDSLLQGMPIGSMMVSEIRAGTPMRRVGQRHHQPVPEGGALALIDGQQRTLAMLIPWRKDAEMDRRLWVDFADDAPVGQLLRLRVTTQHQPHGFQPHDPSRRLSLEDRRSARDAFHALIGEQTRPDLSNAKPFSLTPRLPVDLHWLIGQWADRVARQNWEHEVLDHVRGQQGVRRVRRNDTLSWDVVTVWDTLGETERGQVVTRIAALAGALESLFTLELPLIRVPESFFSVNGGQTGEPPLAVLFKRIGTGGTPLSDADYVYSVIKHLRPETYDLVETMHTDHGTVASLLTATELVSSAVRLAAVSMKGDRGEAMPDHESLRKPEFHRLLQRGDFIDAAFLPLIRDDGHGAPIALYFADIDAVVAYRGGDDPGIPRLAYPLLKRPLVQVLLRLAQIGYLADPAHRSDVLRLVLFWLTCVLDPGKASYVAYQVIGGHGDTHVEIGRAIYSQLIQGNAALALPTPEAIRDHGNLAFSAAGTQELRGLSRFDETPPGNYSPVRYFYQVRWWRPGAVQHAILLWLQRRLVADAFSNGPDALAGKDDDTPYDYDHILPQAHWGGNQGVRYDCVLDFMASADRRVWAVGNSIGNIRVWGSSLNRSDGDLSPAEKLKLDAGSEDPERRRLLRDSAIDPDEAESWTLASGQDGPRKWTRERALAFQNAIEQRAFHLYRRLYEEAGFAVWQGQAVCHMA